MITHVRRNTRAFKLVNLVVHNDVLLITPIQHGSLVDIASSWVRHSPNDVSDICLVRHIVNRHGVFIVSVADIPASVPSIRAAVDQALSVVDVAIAGGAAQRTRIGWVGLENISIPLDRNINLDSPYRRS